MKSFEPVYDNNTEILIIGSFPGIKSLELNQYYGHKQNYFWKILSTILNQDLVNVNYETRLKILLENKIGLWDSIETCVRSGSLDSKITNVKNNDFSKINANLKKIICNGKTSYKNALKCNINSNIEIISVPSTSPANASIKMADKINAWKNALEN